MGTTLVALLLLERPTAAAGTSSAHSLISDPPTWLAHVGDSRCYLCAGRAARSLPHDHSLVEEQVAHGQITRRGRQHSPDAQHHHARRGIAAAWSSPRSSHRRSAARRSLPAGLRWPDPRALRRRDRRHPRAPSRNQAARPISTQPVTALVDPGQRCGRRRQHHRAAAAVFPSRDNRRRQTHTVVSYLPLKTHDAGRTCYTARVVRRVSCLRKRPSQSSAPAPWATASRTSSRARATTSCLPISRSPRSTAACHHPHEPRTRGTQSEAHRRTGAGRRGAHQDDRLRTTGLDDPRCRALSSIEAATERFDDQVRALPRARRRSCRRTLSSPRTPVHISITKLAALTGRPDAGHRHALLQSGAGDEAGRGHPRPADLAGHLRHGPRPVDRIWARSRSRSTTPPASSPTAC